MDLLKKIILIFVLLSIPFGELIRLNFGNNIILKPIDFFAALLFLLFLLHLLFFRKKIEIPFAGPLIIFLFFALVSLISNARYYQPLELLAGVSYLIRWLLYLFLFYLVYNMDLKFRPTIIKALITSGALVVLIGFIQYLFYPNLRNLYYLGWDEHLYRLFSSFLDPNYCGAFLVLFLLLLTGLNHYYFRQRKSNACLLLSIISFLSLIGIFLTYSRSAYIMLIVGTISLLILLKRKALIGVMILMVVLSVIFSPKSFQTEGTNLLRVASSEARIDSARKAFRIFNANPVFGVGFNNFRYAQARYGFLEEGNFENHAGAGTDNSFLFVLATTGVLGFASFGYFWISIVNKIIYGIKNQSDKSLNKTLTIVFFSSLVSLLVNAFFINSLFYSYIIIWMWILLGLVLNKIEGSKANN